MKSNLRQLITDYIERYSELNQTKTNWRQPIIKFARAGDPLFSRLQEVVSPTHALPTDFLEDAETVITYFIPFEKRVARSNIEGKYSSSEWVIAYKETNQLIEDLNLFIKERLAESGYRGSLIPPTHNFDKDKLISDWSHRHAAYIAGLGKFGLNNMLITDRGCCGRIGSLITNLRLEADTRKDSEACLFYSDRAPDCCKCVGQCVNSALEEDSFDRQQCHQMLLSNNKAHPELGYSDVCGKCCVGLPCSFEDPVRQLSIG